MTASPPAKPAATSTTGYVPADGVFTLREACRRLGWCRRAMRQAKRAGLRVVKFGNREYLRGAEVDEFFQGLAEQEGDK